MEAILPLIIEMAVKYLPSLAVELAQLASKPTVTDADWDALKLKYSGKTYEQYIAAAPPCTPPTPTT